MDNVNTDIGALLSSTERAQPYYADMGRCENAVVLPASPLLLVDDEAGTRNRMRVCLTATNFAVTTVHSADEALDAAQETAFSHAVVELRIGGDSGLRLIRKLRAEQKHMRIVVVTGYDSFASVILALRAGAVDYLSKPVDPHELVCALRGEASALPPVPEMPLGLDRVTWEYTQRVFEQCDRCVTRTAQQLGMHRRTLQRILRKRSPQLRGRSH